MATEHLRVDPYVATPPRNKLNNRSNRKEVVEKTRLLGNEREARRFLNQLWNKRRD